MTVSSSNYSGTADGSSHTITLNVTKPTSGITIYYSTSTSLTSSNYTSGSTTKPTRTEAGTTTVYWYVHSTNGNYTDKSGSNTITLKERTVEESKGEVLSTTKATTIKDTYGNSIVVPEGFKIASDSASDVTGGIVIEDVSHGSTTAGSQFVWIPVGTVKYSGGTKTINLNRYTFTSDGTPAAQGDKIINSYYQELATSTYGNTTAKDIEAFKTSAIKNGGYYIGRYEARTATKRTLSGTALTAVTVKPSDYIYNFITQPQAATQCRNMYNNSISSFTSDLINSYAWDTAILFLQEFDNRSSKPYVYSMQAALNSSFAEKGTNNLSYTSQQDKICNIWDMASNDNEWTTESATSTFSIEPCVSRGGIFGSTSNTCSRGHSAPNDGNDRQYRSFRPLLYLTL